MSEVATSARVRNARGQGGRLRAELLDAAVELMAEHGSVDKVSVRAVAGVVGVSPTAVYRHFHNRDDLLWSSVQHCFDEFAAALAEAQETTDDIYEQLARSGRVYVRFAEEHRGKYRVMFSNDCPVPTRAAPVGMGAFAMLVDMIEAILVDRADPRDPRHVAVQVWTWIHGIVDLRASHPHAELWPDVDVLVDELLTRLDLIRAPGSDQTDQTS